MGSTVGIVTLALLSATFGVLTEVRANANPRLSIPPVPSPPSDEPNPAERRAVRGVPLEDATLVESSELREVLRFEAQAFPRPGASLPRREELAPASLPPGLEGRWGGTGDIPPDLRSPEALRRTARSTTTPEAEWLRDLKLPELPVRWEPSLIRYLYFFKNDPKGRSFASNAFRKLGRFRVAAERVFERHGLPRDLIYLAMIESGFEPGAVSRVGAGGVWQFMPAVGRAYGLEVSHWVDARRDPERATEAAARYLKDLYVRFGSWPLAFAAYHAGYGAILRSISRYNTNDYWEMCRHENGLPWETTLYVPKILAVAIIGHNLEAFGFGNVISDADAPLAYERVEVGPGTTLASVAKAAGTRPEVVQSLNPELIRSRTPPDRGNVEVRVPVGSASLYVQSFGSTRGPADRVETIVLRYGETLDDVANARGLPVRELRRLNGVRNSADVRPGTTLVVPLRPSAVANVAPIAGAAEEDDTLLVAVPERAINYEGRERVFYRVREGDTLEELAGIFRVTIDELVEWNNVDPDAKLAGKLVLQVLVAKDFDRANVALLDPAKVRVVTLGSEEFLDLQAAQRGRKRLQYIAKAGDTFAKISRRYGLTPGDLARINRLSYNTELTEGQTVIVYSPTPELPREVTVGRSAPQRRPTDKAIVRSAPAKTAMSPAKAAMPRRIAAKGLPPLVSMNKSRAVAKPVAPKKSSVPIKR